MDFKVRKIAPKDIKTKNPVARKCIRVFGTKHLIILAVAILFFGVVFTGKAFFASSFFETKTRSFLSNDGLKKDKNGHINMLILGVGGKNEEGGLLTDLVMVLSLDPKGPSASILSLPRDLFVASSVGDRKINEVYASARYQSRDKTLNQIDDKEELKDRDKNGENKGLEIAKEAVSNFTRLEIHYAAVVDFQVFEDLVDWVGGFEIFVPEGINDPFYPADNYQYQTFVVRKGIQRFDGATALKYARSRKTSSDYSRAKRQQDILFALQKELEKDGKLLSLLKDGAGITDLYNSYAERVNTDLSLKEIISLAKISIGVDTNGIITAVLNDDPTKRGGLLYTPAKEFFGGQFVLIPENLEDTKLFMHTILQNTELLEENLQISILNGSNLEGAAWKNSSRLRRLGLHVIDTGNYESENGKPVSQTFLKVYGEDKGPETIKALTEIYNIEEVIVVPEEERGDTDALVDIELVLGFNID